MGYGTKKNEKHAKLTRNGLPAVYKKVTFYTLKESKEKNVD